MSRDKNTQTFKNVDGKRLTYTYWSRKPKTTATERECVRNTNKMEWEVTKCGDRLPYICKINKEKVEEEIFVGNCSDGWDHFNGRCYKFFSKKTAWPEARKSCMAYGGDLATVNSYPIQKHLQFLVRSTKAQIWIGVYPLFLPYRTKKNFGQNFRHLQINFVTYVRQTTLIEILP